MAFDHELKLCRAGKHLKDLHTEIKTWVSDGCHHSVRYEFDRDARWTGPVPPGPGVAYLSTPVFIPGQGPGTVPEGIHFGQGVFTAYATAEDPPSDPIGLLIGDCLHNLRSALDNLAYSLASSHTKPLTQEIANSSEFPIFGDEDRNGTVGVGHKMFHQLMKNGDPAPGGGVFKIRGWHPDAQAVVEGLQPYQRGKDFRSDPLWLLHELNRIDKHRLLHPTIASFSGTVWEFEGFRNVRCIGPGAVQSCAGTVETDTPIGRIWGVHPIDPDSQMDVKIQPALDVAFAQHTTVARQPVVRTLFDIYMHIGGAVVSSLAPYL